MAFAVAPGEEAFAGDRNAFEAQLRFNEALKRFDQGEYAEALPLFQRALELSGSPNARLYVARCLRETGRAIEAWEQARRAFVEARERAAKEEKYAETRDLAAAEVALSEGKIGRLVVALARRPEGVAVTVNGAAFPLDRLDEPIAVEPGNVTVEASAPGAKTVREEIDLAPGEMKTVALALTVDAPSAAPRPEPPPKPPPPPAKGGAVRTAGFVVGGVGLVGVAVFAVTGSMASSKYGELEDGCGDRACVDPKYDDVISSGRTLDTVANVALVAGAIGVLGGTAMILFGGPSKSPTKSAGAASMSRASARLTPTSTGALASVAARF